MVNISLYYCNEIQDKEVSKLACLMHPDRDSLFNNQCDKGMLRVDRTGTLNLMC